MDEDEMQKDGGKEKLKGKGNKTKANQSAGIKKTTGKLR